MATKVIDPETGKEVSIPKVTKKLIRANAHNFDVMYNLGTMELNNSRIDNAFSCFTAALESSSRRTPEIMLNLSTCYKLLGNEKKASEVLRGNISNFPDFPLSYNNYGLIRYDDGAFEEAERLYTRAIELKPDYADAHWNLALALLIRRFDTGIACPKAYSEFEWRFKKSNAVQTASVTTPRWQGESLVGKKLLFMCEQGFGDMFMFIRYLMKFDPSTIYVHYPRVMLPFITGYEHVEFSTVPHDYHIPIMSLPAIMGEHFCDPYLTINSHNFGGGKNIGIVWKGNPQHANDRNRSIHFRDFFGLFSLGKVWSLQYGANVTKYAKDIHHLEINSFVDTARYIAGLDLVVTVDTSVAHLAGALGKPCLVIMPTRGIDWRWGSKSETTPWYPSLRLCRDRASMVTMAASML